MVVTMGWWGYSKGMIGEEAPAPKRRGRPPSGGTTPKRSLRIPDELWDELTAAAKAEGVDVATLTRDFYAYWLRRPGAKLPKRPEA